MTRSLGTWIGCLLVAVGIATMACSTDPGGPLVGAGAPNSGGAAGSMASTGGAGASNTGFAGASVAGSVSTGGTPSGAGSAGSPMTGGSSTGGASAQAGAGGGPSTAGTGGAGGGSPDLSNGCGKTSTLTFGAVPGESGQAVGFGTGGYVKIGNRGFALRLPDNYQKDKPYWLIFGFHWRGGNSKEVDTGGSNGYSMAHYGLQKLSQNGAIFVAPDGLGGGWGNNGGEDMKFVDDMVKLIEDNYCVDKKHLFANGFSWGGGMSYAIACARAKTFRGVAIYNGAVLSGCEGGNDPIPYWQMAGLTDTTCTIEAGREMRDKFVKNNGCTPQNPPEPPKPEPFLKSGGHICTTYSGCSGGNSLRWCAHQSGHGNAIVDGTASVYNECATPPKMCSDSCPCTWVPEDVWAFFKTL
jgi:poly(3-hydroxybutyrate) depolymerase